MAKKNGSSGILPGENKDLRTGAGGMPPGLGRDGADTEGEADASAAADQSGEGLSVMSLRHKTIYPDYYRAGLKLSRQFRDYPVTKEQLVLLEEDPWVEVKKP